MDIFIEPGAAPAGDCLRIKPGGRAVAGLAGRSELAVTPRAAGDRGLRAPGIAVRLAALPVAEAGARYVVVSTQGAV